MLFQVFHAGEDTQCASSASSKELNIQRAGGNLWEGKRRRGNADTREPPFRFPSSPSNKCWLEAITLRHNKSSKRRNFKVKYSPTIPFMVSQLCLANIEPLNHTLWCTTPKCRKDASNNRKWVKFHEFTYLPIRASALASLDF